MAICQVKVNIVQAYLKGIISKHGKAKPGMNKIASSCNMTIQEASDCCDYIAAQGLLSRTYESMVAFYTEHLPPAEQKRVTWTVWR
jgi:hypothetical protein